MTARRASRFALESPEPSYEESVRWLRSKLGHASTTLPDEPAKPCRPPEQWLRSVDGSHMRVDLLAEGEAEIDASELTVAITLHDGRCFVGCIELQHSSSIIVRLWGGSAIRISHRSIRRAFLLPSHTAAEVRVVCCRQRCHEPAATFTIADKTIDSKMGISSPTT